MGVVRPGCDHNKPQVSGGHYMHTAGAVYSNGVELTAKAKGQKQNPKQYFETGDRIGVLLDLDAGWIRFFRNGKRTGQGVASGVSGPLVRAVHLLNTGTTITALPNAAAPTGVDAQADEGWEYATDNPTLKGFCKAKGLPVSGTAAELRKRLDGMKSKSQAPG